MGRMPALLLAAAAAVACAPQIVAGSPSAGTDAGGGGKSERWVAYPGKVFSNDQCPDLQNVANTNATGCQAICDATPGCTAINAHDNTGPCALRACGADGCSLNGTTVIPSGTLTGFTAYARVSDANSTACVQLATVFGSGMVLQRAPLSARLFGSHSSDVTSVTVRVTNGVTAEATVAADGSWECTFPPTVQAGGPYNLTVTGTTAKGTAVSTTLTDVLFGDVFVCGGQSNMELPVSLVNNASAELAAAAAFPWIRLAAVEKRSSPVPLSNLGGFVLPWSRASAEALGGNNSKSWDYFSATCWFTAREVARVLGPEVPLGLVGSYVGGTPIESWTPPKGDLYNGMIAPLTGLAIKAILWYQGENNSFKPTKWINYAVQFPAMIALWRQAWVNGTGQTALANTPFGFAQIGPRDCIPCPDHQGDTGTFYGGVRWAQTAFEYHVPNAKMPNTFMAVTADLAEGYSPILPLAAGCVHYGDKQDVGRRLSLGVRAAVYNDPTVREANGPYLASVAASPANGTLTLAFDQPIEVRNASGFEVSTNGEAYVAAGIVTRGADTVTLTTAGLGHGAAVASLRYILHDTPCINQTCAIYASATGLPSGPLVANLPGHAGADSVGWNMTG